ncbi:MAG: hypothetical protein M1814_005876 [Vezdaea aestivalis]|nr:MAG: hypothetical protein M1814_005876 [Vezdaea aestivalis]
MDPNVVGSASFGQLWRSRLTNDCGTVPEQIFAQPLVYTPGATQYVYIASTTNAIYKIDAKTGAIITARTLHVPFLQKDLDGCTDLQPCIGVTGTGTIDPATGTWYFTAKTYADQTGGTTGRLNGRYFVHAIDVNDLSDRPGFPIPLEGLPARNNPKRLFLSGNQHQRPALVLENGFIYAGFASHCVQYNFSGWLMGWDKGGKIVESFAMEGGPEDVSVKGGGIWMGGGGISSDGKGSLWFGTGNGYASQLHGIPVPGRQPPSALEEAAVHMSINTDGSLGVVDFFMPFEKEQLDGADKDLGTSPLIKLPESTFSCGTTKRIGVITGKSGKTYFLNLDDLGGYQNGPNKGDKVIATYLNQNSVYSGAAVYPLEGGYVYIHVVQFPTVIFKFSCGGDGVPTFTYVGQTADSNAYVLGVGHGTTTSLNGQAGTGLVWVSDVQGFNLRIYKIVQNGLNLIKTFQITSVTKFTRPVFGDGRAYIGTTQGYLYAFGSPVNTPLLCSSPVDFGTVVTGNGSQAVTVQCKANITTTVTSISLSSVNFNISSLPNLPLQVQAGTNFSFVGTFRPTAPGPLADDVIVNTTNSVALYSTRTPITFKGIGNSLKPVLQITPNTVSFEGVITGENPDGVDQTVIFINQGSSPLTITGIRYSTTAETGPYTAPNTTANGLSVGPFTFTNIPQTIDSQSQSVVKINFKPVTSGNYVVFVNVGSDGGNKTFTVAATSGNQPKALLEFLKIDGSGWVPYSSGTPFSFGDVYEQTTLSLQMRLTNVGGPQAGRLSVTVSKPPIVANQVVGAVNNVDLGEGTTLLPGESANATLFCSVPKSQVNVPDFNASAVWTMNTGDPNFGKQDIQFYCHAIAEQVGPLTSNGSALYPYVGCYKENNPGRQLDTQRPLNNPTIDACIKDCNAQGFKLAGLEYQKECWCSNTKVPVQKVDELNCNFFCNGNVSQICGGNGINHDGSYISLFGDRTRFNVSAPSSTSSGVPMPTAGPSIPRSAGGYGYVGCASEVPGRLINAKSFSNSSNSVDFCGQYCSGSKYFGVEYGSECYCGQTLAGTPTINPDSDCNTLCPANSTQYCGTGGRVQLYQLGLNSTSTSSSASSSSSVSSSSSSAPASVSASSTSSTSASSTSSTSSTTPTQTSPIIIQSYKTWGYTGCYNEVGGRALEGKTYSKNTNTVESCADFCDGFTLFGVEYGVECYCANKLKAGSTNQSDADCNMLCPANNLEFCGAGNRIQLYTFGTAPNVTTTSANSTSSSTTSASSTTSSASSSSASASSSSASSSSASDSSSSTSSTVSSTVSSSSSSSTNSVSSSSSTSSSVSSSASSSSSSISSASSSSSSSASSSSTSSSSSSNSVSSSASSSASSSSSSSSSSSTSSSVSSSASPTSSSSSSSSSSTTSSSSSTASPSATNSPWLYVGCASETNPRALSGATFADDNMTVDKCKAFCVQKNFPLAGVEYARECYCGTGLSPSSSLGQQGCTTPCGGNSAQTCGGSSRLNVYNYTMWVPPRTVPSVGSYMSQGCFKEVPGRAITGFSFVNQTGMTVELCVGVCQNKGFTYAGLEYAYECYCGNAISDKSVQVDTRSCNKLCSGSQTEFCGAGSLLNVYMNQPGNVTQQGLAAPGTTTTKRRTRRNGKKILERFLKTGI